MEELILLDKRVTIENVLTNSIVSENKHFYNIKYVCCFTFLVLTRRSLNSLPKYSQSHFQEKRQKQLCQRWQ